MSTQNVHIGFLWEKLCSYKIKARRC